MGIKISELNELVEVNSNDVIPVVNTKNQATQKISIENLLKDTKRHIVTANIVTTTITEGVQTTLSVRELCKSGNKLSVENGRIIIGSGVSKVLVYAKVLIDTTELTNNFLYVMQNNIIINRGDGYGKYETLSTPGFLVNVQEGDKFTISVLAGTNASIYDGSYITVEVIE
ncbi:MAG: hypothetical protein HFJ42_09995 [Clostridia bacterium]|nr:hypothetical protein [Clostridia bacterium]